MPFRIIRNDILKTKADAIVNTANPRPIVGSGVDYAIHNAAGPELLCAREHIGEIERGTAVSTPAYNLTETLGVKYIIHTVGPEWEGGNNGERETLLSCFRSCLKTASELGCNSIAFPLISTGTYGFPKGEAISIAIAAFTEFLLNNDMDICLVVFGASSLNRSREIIDYVESYIDDNYVLRKNLENYGHRDGPGNLAEGRRRFSEEYITPLSCFRSEDESPCSYEESKNILADEDCNLSSCSYKSALPMPKKASSGLPFPRKSSGKVKKRTDTDSYAVGKAAPSAAPVSLEEKLKRLDKGFSETLLSMIDASGKSDPEIYRKANIDRKLFSKIKNDPHYKPSKQTVIAFAMALELSIEDTESFLARAGFALSSASASDIIVDHFIRSGNYNIIELNVVLFDFDQQPIGSF